MTILRKHESYNLVHMELFITGNGRVHMSRSKEFRAAVLLANHLRESVLYDRIMHFFRFILIFCSVLAIPELYKTWTKVVRFKKLDESLRHAMKGTSLIVFPGGGGYQGDRERCDDDRDERARDWPSSGSVLLGGIRQVDFGEVFQQYNLSADWCDVQGTETSIPLSP